MEAAGRADERFVASVEQHRSALYSVREVAALLGVHPETIRRLIHDGRMPAVRVGRILRIESYEVDRFLARQRVKPLRIAD
jgi:excisionase family DNA binding protein